MAIRKEGNRWLVDVRVQRPERKRIRKKFRTKPEAIRFEAHVRNLSTQGEAWNPVSTDRRTFRDLVDRWHQVHGINLKDGEARKRKLDNLALGLGDPLASDLSATLFLNLQAKRLQGDRPITANTANHDLAYAKAVYNKLIEIDEWKHDNPLGKLKKIKFTRAPVTFLTEEKQRELLTGAKALPDPDCYIICLICLATGARWGEAESLRQSDVFDRKIRLQSKDGTEAWIPYEHPDIDAHIEGKSGRLFQPCYEQFRRLVASLDLDLPPGQLTHVLRHTFATYFMKNGGDIITLRDILRHTTLAMTERYAHFAPGRMAEVPSRSPLTNLKS